MCVCVQIISWQARRRPIVEGIVGWGQFQIEKQPCIHPVQQGILLHYSLLVDTSPSRNHLELDHSHVKWQYN
jgi:hypothetical protein